MARRVRVPGLLDVVAVDAARDIRDLAGDPRIDRDFASPTGPLLNRLILGRIRSVLSVANEPLPTVAPLGHAGRAKAQAELGQRLDARVKAGDLCSPAHLAELSSFVRGRVETDRLGPLLQEIVGRLFVDDYRASADTFEAAATLDTAARSLNPFRYLKLRLTGRVDEARKRLREAARGDPVCVHATGIALHNLVAALHKMRALAEEGRLTELAPEAAVARCLVAPASVPRQAVAAGSTAVTDFDRGTLLLFNLDAARAASGSEDLAFMSFAWSRCPASSFVPALLAAAWRQAALETETGGTP